jgi:hypothetical protein
LLEEFKHFLPDTSTVPQVLAVPKGVSVKQDGDKAKRSVPSIKVNMDMCHSYCYLSSFVNARLIVNTDDEVEFLHGI